MVITAWTTMKLPTPSALCCALCLALSPPAWAAAAPAPPAKTASAAPVDNVTQSDILALTRQVLDTSKSLAEQQHRNLSHLGLLVGGIVAVLGFFGFREFHSIVKPFKDKLETLQSTHETSLANQLLDFQERSHHNARALVATQITWDQLSVFDKIPAEEQARRELVLAEIVRHIDRAMPPGYQARMDPYLAGLLLIRKAYAMRYLGDVAGALALARVAINLDGDASKGLWVFNAACYAALLMRAEECCELLAEAIRIDPRNRADAETDEDFDGIRQHPAFVALLARTA